MLVSLSSCRKQELKKNGCGTPSLLFFDGENSISINNVFTPNGDGYNDVLLTIVSSPDLTDYRFEIKRKGKIYFSTTNPQNYWDGMNQGEEAKEGVYDYKIDGNFNGINLSFERTITLVRGKYEPYHYLGDCSTTADPIL